MITDNETNFLYLADTLKIKYPNFWSAFEKVLKGNNIRYGFIPHTKDVWAVDYMPVQVNLDKLVKFIYLPDYLNCSKKWRSTISNVSSICDSMKIEFIESKIKIDGGNIVRSRETIIMCDKVFRENPTFSRTKLIDELEDLLEVNNIIFIPQDPFDIIGHADGMVRFLDSNTVLINNYAKIDKSFAFKLKSSLRNAGLEYLEITYNPF